MSMDAKVSQPNSLEELTTWYFESMQAGEAKRKAAALKANETSTSAKLTAQIAFDVAVGSAKAELDAVVLPARREYEIAIAPALALYNEAGEQAERVYNNASQAAKALYQRQRREAEAACKLACDQAIEIYEVALEDIAAGFGSDEDTARVDYSAAVDLAKQTCAVVCQQAERASIAARDAAAAERNLTTVPLRQAYEAAIKPHEEAFHAVQLPALAVYDQLVRKAFAERENAQKVADRENQQAFEALRLEHSAERRARVLTWKMLRLALGACPPSQE
jgi:hypothetical protein